MRSTNCSADLARDHDVQYVATVPQPVVVVERQASPNRDPRPVGQRIDMLVVHYTGMVDAAAAIARLCDPATKVSAHYLIDEDGRIVQLVPDVMRAWHAGVSTWAGASDINARSIGIELVNPGHEFGYRRFADAQMRSLIALARAVVNRHAIPAARVLGHSDVAPGRKADPGELFDWARLARHGIGLWPTHWSRAENGVASTAGGGLKAGDRGEPVLAMQRDFAAYGYGVAAGGEFDQPTEQVVIAFQRHFRPARIDGIFDRDCAERLRALLKLGAVCTN